MKQKQGAFYYRIGGVDSDTQSQSGPPQAKTQGREFNSHGLAEAQAGAIPARSFLIKRP